MSWLEPLCLNRSKITPLACASLCALEINYCGCPNVPRQWEKRLTETGHIQCRTPPARPGPVITTRARGRGQHDQVARWHPSSHPDKGALRLKHFFRTFVLRRRCCIRLRKAEPNYPVDPSAIPGRPTVAGPEWGLTQVTRLLQDVRPTYLNWTKGLFGFLPTWQFCPAWVCFELAESTNICYVLTGPRAHLSKWPELNLLMPNTLVAFLSSVNTQQ